MGTDDLKWFKDTVNMGDDIVFNIGQKQYWIGTLDGGRHVISQNPDGPENFFADADDLLNSFTVDGIPLGRQLDKIAFVTA